MSVTITAGWWLLPLAVSIAAVWWCVRQDSRDYNFTSVFTLLMTGFVICLAWMIYFGLGWALS